MAITVRSVPRVTPRVVPKVAPKITVKPSQGVGKTFKPTPDVTVKPKVDKVYSPTNSISTNNSWLWFWMGRNSNNHSSTKEENSLATENEHTAANDIGSALIAFSIGAVIALVMFKKLSKY